MNMLSNIVLVVFGVAILAWAVCMMSLTSRFDRRPDKQYHLRDYKRYSKREYEDEHE